MIVVDGTAVSADVIHAKEWTLCVVRAADRPKNERAEEGVLKQQNSEPVYLTNHIEATDIVGPELLTRLGLDFGELNGFGHKGIFWPLTDRESEFALTEDGFAMRHGAGYVLLGYTTLYKGQKYVCAEIEYSYDEEDVPLRFKIPKNDPRRQEVKKVMKADLDRLVPHVEALGGLILESEWQNRFNLSIHIPMSEVMKRFENREQYKNWLCDFLEAKRDDPPDERGVA